MVRMSQTKIRGALSNGPGKTELCPATTGATVSRLGVVIAEEGWKMSYRGLVRSSASVRNPFNDGRSNRS